MSDPRPIVVLGASGNVGSALTTQLAQAGEAVRALYQPAPGEVSTLPQGVEEIHGSLDDIDLVRRAMTGARSVFMLTPPSPSQPAWNRTIVTAARDAGVARVVKLSAFDSGVDSSLFMGRWHADGEAVLAESGIDHVILRPQYFMQMMPRMLGAGARTGVMRGAADVSVRMGFVDVRDIAAVAAVALISSEYDGRILVPTGPAAPSYGEIAHAVSVASGRDVRYEKRSESDIRADFTARGWPEWHIDDYLKIHSTAASELVTGDVLEVTGRAPRSVFDLIDELDPDWV
jgi:uncharacterized protein YbjT (DUF2867 family)